MEYLKTYEELIHDEQGYISPGIFDSYTKIEMSKELINLLKNIQNNEYSSLFLSLLSIKTEYLQSNRPDYLDIDNDGNVSYLDFKFIEKRGSYYFNDYRRQRIKVTRILSKLIKPEYITISQVEIEKFSNAWKAMFSDEIDVQEFKGEEILRAYNYNGEVKNAGGSCAIFPGCGKKEKFNVLTNNDNFSAFVVFDNTGIVGRTLAISGTQVETQGIFKKGEYYKILNNFYGKGGPGSPTDIAIRNYAKIKGYRFYNHYGLKHMENHLPISYNKDIFKIKIENAYQELNYPSIDGLYFNFNTKELATNYPDGLFNNEWVNMYNAKPRKSKLYDK